MNNNPLKLTKNQLRILNRQLSPRERKSLRNHSRWETCLSAWLNSAAPSEVREWMAGPEEEFRQHIDNLTLNIWLRQNEEDQVEVMKQELPGDEDEDETEIPLTEQERTKVLALAS